MKLNKITALSGLFALALVVSPSVIGSSAQRVGQYDFTYFTSGEQRATPVQVFDDGKSTYFQFRAGEAIPAIFSNKDGKVGLLVPYFEGPYIRVQETSGRFTLQLGRAQAQVVYGGSGREETPAIDAVNRNGLRTAYNGGGYPANANVKLIASLGPTLSFLPNDALESNSYATPAKGDRVTWKEGETELSERQVFFVAGTAALGPQAKKALNSMTAQVKSATSITIIGRDDSSEKEGLEKARADNLRDALLKMGISADRISVKIGVKGTPKDKLWPSDIRIERVVPTAIARPSEAQNEKTAHVQSNVESLVRAGVLTRDQAIAILRKKVDLHSETVASAVPASAPAPQAPVNLEVPPTGFDFRSGDKTIAGSIRRWADATNYQLIWDAAPSVDAPVTGDAVIAAVSMKEALDKVVTALQRKGYDIQATVYSNRVVRFTGGTK
ncbi:TcpQ domain-containing protein [Polaromonas aquatica]|uniref:TcpQ domain-containing protein n=1 Tax=Polaromonas aquatica TaxID=332657 RepID=A0ABW1TWG8_9BURK